VNFREDISSCPLHHLGSRSLFEVKFKDLLIPDPYKKMGVRERDSGQNKVS
jgi:hypothetical protein